ncbi:APC family permease [Rubritalea profundi]|uniref:Amino acid permease n=1 Tax=Rubritalea profundi TaxID=1658618 RepID=A0A2S7U2K0_9BACT|nr:APC family permease [Rubritalea profundi]PQJ28651.1 amino acid permease [Rubritalea profundi]
MIKRLIREQKRPLGLIELIAIALGGMVGGGIFAILGVSVEAIGNSAPVAIFIGGLLALCAAYSYVKLARLYKDEGATYSFFKKTYPDSHFAAAAIGWLVAFGYISTLALYAFTFSSYFCTAFSIADYPWSHQLVAGLVILFFAAVNLISVKGMGELEDVMVYTKIILLIIISALLTWKGDIQQALPLIETHNSWASILMIAAVTFVAYEGFQLVIHAYHEVDEPERNIPRAIYGAIVVATILYVVLAIGALATIPKAEIIAGKEYALAAGSERILGKFGYFAVLSSALLATSSAISGTLFGASRLMAVIADDGYFPKALRLRIKGHIPRNAIWTMFVLAFLLVLGGGLQVILEFGSVTFIIVSFLMALANFKKRRETSSHVLLTLVAMISLLVAGVLILGFELIHAPKQLAAIIVIYVVLIVGAWIQSRLQNYAVSVD